MWDLALPEVHQGSPGYEALVVASNKCGSRCVCLCPCCKPSLPILSNGPRQANLVLIAYASSEGSGEPAHPRSLARTSAARSYKQ